MSGVDLIGYLAAGLVLATFCMRDMLALRTMAVASNLVFVCYGLLSGTGPVLALHLLLLPINVMQLMGMARQRPSSRAQPAAHSGLPRNPERAHHD
ncbi:MAG: hypothetical protein LH480_03745 [Rubrivivax sp.]|nr:hypothetical protein [Rubrivivax sp.]